MVKDVKIVNGDIALGEFVEDTECAAQALSIEYSTRLGEWFYDEDYGTDFEVLQGKVDEDDVINEIARVTANETRLETDGNIEITIDQARRGMSVYVPLINVETGEETGLEVDAEDGTD